MNTYLQISERIKQLMDQCHSSILIPVQQSREEFLGNYPSLSNTDVLILDYDELLR